MSYWAETDARRQAVRDFERRGRADREMHDRYGRDDQRAYAQEYDYQKRQEERRQEGRREAEAIERRQEEHRLEQRRLDRQEEHRLREQEQQD